MRNFTAEQMEKAKAAKSVEELLVLAKENGVEMTEEEAGAYYAQLHPVSGEMADDELENVAGGGCHSKDGRLVVTLCYSCDHCDGSPQVYYEGTIAEYVDDSYYGFQHICKYCKYLHSAGGLNVCDNPANKG